MSSKKKDIINNKNTKKKYMILKKNTKCNSIGEKF